MKKIDGHVHLVQEIAGFNGKGWLNALGNGEAIWDDGTKIKLIPDGWGDTNLTADSFLKVMKRFKLGRIILTRRKTWLVFKPHWLMVKKPLIIQV